MKTRDAWTAFGVMLELPWWKEISRREDQITNVVLDAELSLYDDLHWTIHNSACAVKPRVARNSVPADYVMLRMKQIGSESDRKYQCLWGKFR